MNRGIPSTNTGDINEKGIVLILMRKKLYVMKSMTMNQLFVNYGVLSKVELYMSVAS